MVKAPGIQTDPLPKRGPVLDAKGSAAHTSEERGWSATMQPEKAQATAQNVREVTRCPGCGRPLIRVPVLACTRCGNTHPLRAYTYKRDGKYIAECIDLDILSQGDTLEEAIGKLQEAMFGYMNVAFSEGSTKGLVLRKSPLSHRLRYYLHRLRCLIPGHRRSGEHFVFLASVSTQGQSLSHC